MRKAGNKTYRLVVAEDHASVREALVRMIGLQEDMEVVGEAVDGNEAVRLALSLAPDVVLLDVRMPGLNGIQVIERLRQARCRAKIVVLSAYDDETYISEAVKSGADGYLLKGSSMQAVVDAVRSVGEGTTVLPPDVAEPLARRYREEEALLGAFQRLLGARMEKGSILEAACLSFCETMEADCAALFELPGEGGGTPTLAVSCRGPGEEVCSFEELSIPDSALRSLAESATGGHPVVLNAFEARGGAEQVGGGGVNLIVVPVRPGAGVAYMSVCARTKPFSPHPSILRGASLLASQTALILEAEAQRRRAADGAIRARGLERMAAGLFEEAAWEMGAERALAVASELLEAKASCLLLPADPTRGGDIVAVWNMTEEEARALAREGMRRAVIAGPLVMMAEDGISWGGGVAPTLGRPAGSILVLPIPMKGVVVDHQKGLEGMSASAKRMMAAPRAGDGLAPEREDGARVDGVLARGNAAGQREEMAPTGMLCAVGEFEPGFDIERGFILSSIAEGLARALVRRR